jgi:hypothetical protein
MHRYAYKRGNPRGKRGKCLNAQICLAIGWRVRRYPNAIALPIRLLLASISHLAKARPCHVHTPLLIKVGSAFKLHQPPTKLIKTSQAMGYGSVSEVRKNARQVGGGGKERATKAPYKPHQ